MNRTWKTKDGRVMKITDMESSHIENCVNLIKQKGAVSLSTLKFYLSCPRPSGDAAQLAFDQECDEIFGRPVSVHLDWFKEELEERNKILNGNLEDPFIP